MLLIDIGYVVIESFLTPIECELITKEVEANIADWFTRQNLMSHAAYISDDNIGRRCVTLQCSFSVLT
jgi:hypothetical protein